MLENAADVDTVEDDIILGEIRKVVGKLFTTSTALSNNNITTLPLLAAIIVLIIDSTIGNVCL